MFYVNNISYGYYEWNNNVNNEIFKKIILVMFCVS